MMASVKIGMEQASVSHLEQVLLEGDEDQNEVRGSRHSHLNRFFHWWWCW